MKKIDPNMQFQCHVKVRGAFIGLAVLWLLILFVFIDGLLGAASVSDWFAVGIVGGLLLLILVHILLQAATVLTITADTVRLTRFGKPRIEFPRSEITAVGWLVRSDLGRGKDVDIYIASEKPGTKRDILYHRLKRTANKKGAAYICIEPSPQRTPVLQALFPPLDPETYVSYDRPEGRKWY